MASYPYHSWFHRCAVLTLCTALLPIAAGALVTTQGAGMAFRDWPSSDGHNMLLYPWLKSDGHKFLEHGHRLAGMLIGLVSIGLAALAWRVEDRRWVRCLSAGVLLGVSAQGWLGGQRVLLNAQGLAFVHGSFAALVFVLMGTVATVTSRSWLQAECRGALPLPRALRVLGLATCGAILVQYVLGGLLRHQGVALYEHLGFAFLTAVLAVALASGALWSGVAWFRIPAVALGVLITVQLALGASAWITKYGFGDHYQAVYGSPAQIISRTGHVLVGMFTLLTAVVLSLRLCRWGWQESAVTAPDAERKPGDENGLHSASFGLPIGGVAR